MFARTSVLTLGVLLSSLIATVSALGSLCAAPLTAGNSTIDEPFWLENIVPRGTAPYAPDPATYQVYRNVKDYGAVGDGVTDDTAAINLAISTGGRCGSGCGSSTTTPAVVYFPQGTYLVSSPIIAYYFTVLVGDAKELPTILAAPTFNGIAVFDADPYGSQGNWYVNQDNFYRSIRNFVIDVTQMPAISTATGIHWQVSQATSLMNIIVYMSTAPGNNHQGIYMEDGSGGFMGDMVFNGGKYGLYVGNQQFTVRNVTVNDAQTAVYGAWAWGWTWQSININDCQTGFELYIGTASGSAQGVGGYSIIDVTVTNTPVFLQRTAPANYSLDGSIVLNNIELNNVSIAINVTGGGVLLEGAEGDTLLINSWAQGNVYNGNNANGTYTTGYINTIDKSPVLLDAYDKIVSRGHPQYADYSASQFMSVKAMGAVGDGVTDDTAALQQVFDNYAGCYIIYFDAGTYVVSSTLNIPAGSQVVGEAWTTVIGNGSFFQDMEDPQPVVRVGEAYSYGIMEITDMIFTARGPAPGAIVVEWNVHEPVGSQGTAGTWDTHIILGGRNGSNLQPYNCAATNYNVSSECYAAFMGLHLTQNSNAYLEGLWVWLADHDLDYPGNAQLSLWSGRGIVSQSLGPTWFIGTAEHSTIVQYNLAGAQNHYIGAAQTETPYYQPAPASPAPFVYNASYYDPTYYDGMAFALDITDAENILVFGAGFYSFFQNYTQGCLATYSCQEQIVNVDSLSSASIYGLQTVASTYMLSMDYEGVVYYLPGRDGFSETMTAWTPWA